jgi:hypothetical protein
MRSASQAMRRLVAAAPATAAVSAANSAWASQVGATRVARFKTLCRASSSPSRTAVASWGGAVAAPATVAAAPAAVGGAPRPRPSPWPDPARQVDDPRRPLLDAAMPSRWGG